MARINLSYYFICVFLLISLRISTTASSSDYNFYDSGSSHHVSEHSLTIELFDDKIPHSNQKRDLDHNNAPATDARNISTTTPVPKKKTGKMDKNPYPLDVTKSGIMADKSSKSHDDKVNIATPLVHNMENANEKNETAPSINLPRFPSDIDTPEGGKKFNETLKNHNITSTKTNNISFYSSKVSNDPKLGKSYWVDMKNTSDVKVSKLLSESHRRAATVKLSFEFPFYGHLIKNVTIATGGFLYTGDYVHSWLAATQYIAPLMANFDTSISNTSFIKYLDNGTSFTVEWERVTLQDKPEHEFTFQTTLFKNGDIVFVYKEVPIFVEDIAEIHHPVKVGLSDAYIMDQEVLFTRRKTIFEYDRVNINKTEIRNWTSVYLAALPTCMSSNDCVSCVTKNIGYPCSWCPTANKCSHGFDRHRQEWLSKDCRTTAFTNVTYCHSYVNKYPGTSYNSSTADEEDGYNEADGGQSNALLSRLQRQDKVGTSSIVAVLFLVGTIFGMVVWLFYAYRNPHTFSGQILIRYRPSQWSWRRGEARYTAATIHM
ncbi:unnamed protein product [Acanthoscelides obtectus]|uniref:Plexin domain-containing protein 2 n=1 Tax=Acanthoscelides obtectus TaxID=200917 RepID=A0A9P0JXN8_ACAOB|nr:unnamed protein product [Acanthoscelides obtectus]CAK1637382.1 Plexin domain-containing protein 2 [Acanthoscelides obtectus]